MDDKTLKILEYPKILERLARYAAFSASAELARALRPTSSLEDVQQRLTRTTEARRLLSLNNSLRVGGVSDIRPQADLAAHGGVLFAPDLVEIKHTLISARNLGRTFASQPTRASHKGREKEVDAKTPPPDYPLLSIIASALFPPAELINAIDRCLSDSGEILDQASERLSQIRSELRSSHERLLGRLERLINDPKLSPVLMEPIITQRNGRYVVPLRAEFKGKLRSIIHDQSSSGATLFVEPLAVVELNNRWHELQLAEQEEERRILADLSRQVGLHVEQINQIVAALAELDLALMCAYYAEDLKASEPLLLPFKPASDSHPGSMIHLYQARHPLLDQQKAMPLDIDLDERTFAVVITGPNTGGKTVTLKTMGLLALMAQSGLHIPAQSGSSFSLFEDILADIGDEQSIEQSLSTFSGHIRNIIRIFKRASRTSLILLDELGSGTDPQEGASLARALLAHLIERRITCLVATHYPELKTFAHTTPGAINASMEFDLRTLRPTYRLNIGLPGRSNALLIAERLGLSQEIIQTARETIRPEDMRSENLLDEIHRQRDLARSARAEAENARVESVRLRAELSNRLENLEDERMDVLQKARQQAQSEIEELHRELAELRRSMSRTRQPVEDLKPIQEQVDALQEVAEEPIQRRARRERIPKRPLQVGDKIQLRSLKTKGIITTLDDSGAEVQLGALRIRVKLNDIQRSEDTEETPTTTPITTPAMKVARKLEAVFHPSPGIELDVRGEISEDALDKLERHLESAFLAGLPYIRVIHGKGSGKLRQVIRQALRQSPHVTSWAVGREEEGGDGVTVAHLSE